MSFYPSKNKSFTVLIASALFVVLGIYFTAGLVWAAPNLQINYQGKLTNASNVAVADAGYQMEFSLYTAPTGGTAVWTETRTGVNEVIVENGLFSVMLGSVNPLTGVDFNQTLYLGVTVEADSEMTPRKVLGAVPAAFEANNANTVGGVASTSILRNDRIGTISTTSASTLLTVTQSGTGDILNLFDGGTEVFSVLDGGNVGIGSTSPSAKLTVSGNTFIGGNLTATGTLTVGTLSGLLLGTNGAVSAVATSTLGIALSDTTGTLAATRGGTGLSTITQNQLLIGGAGNTWTQIATSSLGLLSSAVTGIGPTGQIQTGPTVTFASSTGSFNGLTIGNTITATGNTITFTPSLSGLLTNAGLATPYLSFATTSTGTDLSFSSASSTLGGTVTLNIPSAGPSARGLLTSADWTTFNGKISSTSIDTIGELDNLITDVTGVTGSGSFVLSTSPTFTGTALFASTTNSGRLTVAGTSTFATTTITDLALSGALRDTTNSAGTLGMVLQTTGTSTRWVATSTLGLGGSNFFTDAGATTYLTSLTDNLALGTTSASDRLTVVGSSTFMGNSSGVYSWTNGQAPATAAMRIGLDSSGNGLIIKQADGGSTNTFFGVYNQFGTEQFAVGNGELRLGANQVSAVGGFRSGSINATGADARSIFVASATSTSAMLVVDGRSLAQMQANDRTTPLMRFSRFNADGGATAEIANSFGGINGFDTGTTRGLTLTTYSSSTGLFVDAMTLSSNGNVGIGSSSPSSKLTVAGAGFFGGNLTATGTLAIFGTSTLATTTITRLALAGALLDSTNDSGTLGMVLQSTGTSTRWVATSTLGLGGGSSLFTDGGASTFLTSLTDNLAIGTTSASDRLTVNGNINLLGGTAAINWEGNRVLFASTTRNNYFFGNNAGSNVTTGSNIIAIGTNAFLNATSVSDSIAIGRDAGIANTSGNGNVFIGPAFAGYSNTTGGENIFIGYAAGGNSRTGSGNTFMGNNVGNGLVSGDSNTYFGSNAAVSLATSSQSTIIGAGAGWGFGGAYSASNLTILGREAGFNLQTGANNNILIGHNAANSMTTGANNLIIGYNIEAPSNTASNQLNIGNLIFGTGIDGENTTLSSGNIGIGTTSPSARLTVAGTFRATGTSTLATTTITDLALSGALRDSTNDSGTMGMVLQTTGTSTRWVATSTLGLGGGSSLFTDGGASTFLTSLTDNLAIGTSSGTARLTVAGGIDIDSGSDGISILGQRVFYASTTNSSLSLGQFAGGALLGTAFRNTALGYRSLRYATSSSNNTAVGYGALEDTTAGNGNTAVGNQALTFNNTGYQNSALGSFALYSNTSGFRNTAIGEQSLYNNSTGTNNTAVGAVSLFTNTTGYYNTAIGDGSLYANTTGLRNTAIGYNSLVSNSTGTNNTAIGTVSLFFNTTGYYNTAVGDGSLYANTTGFRNVAVGFNALDSNTSARQNTAVGFSALSANTTGDFNVALGSYSLFDNSTGTRNTAVGDSSLGSNTVGSSNTALGMTSLFTNTTGGSNTAVGDGALYNNATGSFNTALGRQALNFALGSDNTALGYRAGYNVVSGSDNTFVGYNTGLGITTGSNNTILGANVSGLSTSLTNNIIVADGSGNQRINVDATGNVGIGTTSPSARLTVAGTFRATGTSTLATTTITDLALSGALRDSTNDSGTMGMVLQTTGTSTRWVATSTLGLGGGSSLFTDGGASTFLTSLTDNLAIGTTSASDRLTVNGNINLLGNTAALNWNGSRILFASTTRNNYFFGAGAGGNVTTGSNIIAIGLNAFANATSVQDIIAIGTNAGLNNTLGNGNVFIGPAFAGFSNTTGSENIFIGYAAGGNNTSGFGNTLIGNNVGNSLRSGDSNTYFGAYSGQNLATTSQSTIIGSGAGFGFGGDYAASNLTILGREAGFNLQTGANNNILIGHNAANSLTTGANNLIIGYNIEAPSNTASNQLNIGNLIFGTGIDGENTTLSSGNIGIGSTSPSAKLTVAGEVLIASSTHAGTMFSVVGTSSRNLIRVSQVTNDPLDVQRVTIGQGGIAASIPDSLARDQLYVFGRINSSWNFAGSDFLGGQISLAADGFVQGGLFYDFITGGSFAPFSLAGLSGTNRLSTGATIGHAGFVGSGGVTQTELSLNPVMETRVIVNTSSALAVAGFSSRALNAAFTTNTNNATNQAFFRKASTSNNWEAVTRSTATTTETITTLATACTGGTACTSGTFRNLRIEMDGVARSVTFIIDGTVVATHLTAVPATSTRLAYDVGITAHAAAASTMDIDFLRVWSDDPAGATANGTALELLNSLVTEDARLDGNSIAPSSMISLDQSLTNEEIALTFMGTTTLEQLENAKALFNDGTPTLFEYGNYLVQNTKLVIEKLSDIFIDTVLWVRGIKTEKVETQELCIEDVCVTKDQLQQMLDSANIQPPIPDESHPVPKPDPDPIVPPDEESPPAEEVVDPQPEVTPEPVPEVAEVDQPPTSEPPAEESVGSETG